MICERRCVGVFGVFSSGVAWGCAVRGGAAMPRAAVHDRSCGVIRVSSRRGGTCGVVVGRVLSLSVTPCRGPGLPEGGVAGCEI